jgi:type IV secretory pathway VirB4 component
MADNRTPAPKPIKDTVQQHKGSPAVSTQLYLDIAEIKDNVVVLKNGGLRAVLQTSSVNFNLKSEEEQNSIIYAYQSFLNSIDFPIQISIQSRKLDVDKYIETVRETAAKHENELLKEQTLQYAEYIQKLVEYADIMEKNFFVVVPLDPYRTQDQGTIAKFMQSISAQDSIENIKRRHHEFEDLNKKLTERVNLVKTGLEGCNLRVTQLTTPQLIELYYKIYNPQTSRNEKIADVSMIDLEQV